jgi:hypothetical protein
MFSGVFIVEQGDGIGEKGSGETKTVDVQTVLEVFFEHVPQICLFH